MKIKKLHIENYKSIKDLAIENPNPFSVFVGPNGAGKSNIFEALEFVNYTLFGDEKQVVNLFGGIQSVFNKNASSPNQFFFIDGEHTRLIDLMIEYIIDKNEPVGIYAASQNGFDPDWKTDSERYILVATEYHQLALGFSRIFLNNSAIKKLNKDDDITLNLDGSNIEKVLSRILQNKNNREEIIEWLQVLIPEFKDIQIETSGLSGDVSYAIFEKHTNKPFPKHLISDGTKNILALLTAVYQSDEPQFLCIEEPENGLHPHVIRELVSLFRNACKEKGHYIWLNTHSETLVRQLTADEIIVVDKKNGATNVRQFKGENLFGLKMDEAWLTNALGGGLP